MCYPVAFPGLPFNGRAITVMAILDSPDRASALRPQPPRLPLHPLVALVLAMLLCVAAAAPVPAQDTAVGRSFALVASEWQRTFDTVERAINDQQQVDEGRRRRWDAQLTAAIDDARAFEGEARREIEAQTRLLDALGPAPAEGQPAEARDVARERKEISDALALYRARLAQAELAVTRAAALQEALATTVRQRFLQRLLQRDPSPLAPGVMQEGLAAALDRFQQTLATPAVSWAALTDEQRTRLRWLLPATLVLAGCTAFVLRHPLNARGTRRLAGGGSPPSVGRRLTALVLRTIADGILPAMVLAAPVLVLWGATDLPAADPGLQVVIAVMLALAALVVGAAVVRGALAPPEADAGLSSLTAPAARALCGCIALLGLVFVVEMALRRAAAALPPAPPALDAVDGLVYCGFAAIGLALAARGRVWRRQQRPAKDVITLHDEAGRWQEAGASSEPGAAPEEAAPTAVGAEKLAHRPLDPAKTAARIAALLAGGATIAAAIGQTRLAMTIVDTLLWAATALGLCLLARTAGRAAITALLRTAPLRPTNGLTATTARGVLAAVRVLIDPALVAVAIWALAPLWGLARADLARWGRGMLEGFTIGGVTISLTAVAMASVVLVIALATARAGRRTLANKLLPRTRLDAGVQHSISVGAGYAGVVAAFLMAISVLGVDLSSFAIVAGALSVGIGFGLQAIVNNFVSGLILLIERPVKVGDWVAVGSQQGVVKRINVRSTELETFERSTIIVPNSDLLSNAVVNWTHRDRVGRVDVRVSIDQSVDSAAARELLLACARDHSEVLGWPQPFVLLAEFADNALVFELRAFLRNVEKRVRVASDLRFAIDRACRDAGIAYPSTQSEIHLRDIERLERALSRLAAQPEAGTPAARSRPRRIR